MNEQWEKAHSLADNELNAEEQAQATALVNENQECKAEYEWAVVLKSQLQTKCIQHRSDECWKRVTDQLEAIDRTKKAERFVSRYAWALPGIFVVAIVSAGIFNRINGPKDVSTRTLAGLVNTLSPVNASDNSSAQAKLHNRMGSVPVQVDRLQVVGENYGQINGRSAATFALMDRSGSLELMMIEGKIAADGLNGMTTGIYKSGSINGLPCIVWNENGYGFVLSGQRSSLELIDAADTLRRAR